jgi:hypothetical protein
MQGESKHTPLVQHMQELLLQYVQRKDPDALSPDPREQQQHMLELMHSSSLLYFQEVYCWLNEQLQGLKVGVTARVTNCTQHHVEALPGTCTAQ